MSFCYVIWAYAGFKNTIYRAPEMHVTYFFTILVLHFGCMPVARDGLNMMKYALLHPDEFDHPVSAFMIGLFNLTEMIFAEVINMVNNQTKKTPADAIAGYIGFAIIIQLPVVFMNSFEEFPQKAAVGKLEQKRRRVD